MRSDELKLKTRVRERNRRRRARRAMNCDRPSPLALIRPRSDQFWIVLGLLCSLQWLGRVKHFLAVAVIKLKLQTN